jgi:hypothetical protein
MEKQTQERGVLACGETRNQHDSSAAQTTRRLLIPSSRAVAAKMLGIFREEINVLLKKKGWTDEDAKAFGRMKEAIRLVER